MQLITDAINNNEQCIILLFLWFNKIIQNKINGKKITVVSLINKKKIKNGRIKKKLFNLTEFLYI